MAAWKLGPVLASGSVTVLKPAEQTPLSVLRVGELVMEAGFPAGVVNILPGYGPTAGKALSTHPLVDKVAFTGSTEVGKEIMKSAHDKGYLKRITLELGGKSANIIMDDADLDLAVEQSSFALFFNHGQCCCAGSRLFVHEKIYDEFIERSIARAKKISVGNPLEQGTDQGPQVDKEQMDKILGYIDSGKKQGAKLAIGGNRHGSKGYFVEPTVFTDVTDDMTIAREEIFGPVMSILKFKTVDEVIARANDSNYGLAAGIVSNGMDNIFRLVNGLRAGTVYVNCYDVFDAKAPFGGFKESGIGRELGYHGLENYLETKTVLVSRAPDALP